MSSASNPILSHCACVESQPVDHLDSNSHLQVIDIHAENRSRCLSKTYESPTFSIKWRTALHVYPLVSSDAFYTMSATPSDQVHPELQKLRVELQVVHNDMEHFGLTLPKPPIVDSSIHLNGQHEGAEDTKEAVPGLRALRESVRRDLDVLDKFLSDPNCASMPALSTNAPYLIAVWNEVLFARSPIVTIGRMFQEQERPVPPRGRGSQKPPGVKVDVVADDGRHWIRVNTVKNSRMLAEFREFDSYMTDSEDDSDNPHSDERPSLAPTEFDNSVLRMGRALLAAASQNPITEAAEVPRITLRLTRLEPSPANKKEHDPRVAQTIRELCKIGIDVQLGERDKSIIPTVLKPSPSPRLEPTTRINLDLSTLIALVSDITHSSPPSTAEEADVRYIPPPESHEWKRKRIEAAKGSTTAELASMDLEDGSGKHSRALANQAMQEMSIGLLQDVHDRLAMLANSSRNSHADLVTDSSETSPVPKIEFWTTPDARDRCLKIVLSKIGGPNEKRRAQALFPDTAKHPMTATEAVDAYWLHSRYPQEFIPLLPIHIFPSSEPDQDLNTPSCTEDGDLPLSPFFSQLARTCRDVLAQETMPDPRTTFTLPTPEDGEITDDRAQPDELGDDGDDEQIQRAVVTRANPRLTAHTVQSLLWGAVRGWTTLTANKSSVKAILRGMKAARNAHGHGWVQDAGVADHEQSSVQEAGVVDQAAVEKAALWLVDPRSLAEGMRSDRDYSRTLVSDGIMLS